MDRRKFAPHSYFTTEKETQDEMTRKRKRKGMIFIQSLGYSVDAYSSVDPTGLENCRNSFSRVDDDSRAVTFLITTMENNIADLCKVNRIHYVHLSFDKHVERSRDKL